MKVGDLVVATGIGKSETGMGFITHIQDRHHDGMMWFFVLFPDRKESYWYHPSKLEKISGLYE